MKKSYFIFYPAIYDIIYVGKVKNYDGPQNHELASAEDIIKVIFKKAKFYEFKIDLDYWK